MLEQQLLVNTKPGVYVGVIEAMSVFVYGTTYTYVCMVNGSPFMSVWHVCHAVVRTSVCVIVCCCCLLLCNKKTKCYQ